APPPQDGVSANSTTSAFLGLPSVAGAQAVHGSANSFTSSVRPEREQVSPEAPERFAVQALAAAVLAPAAVDPVEPAGPVLREPRAAAQLILRLRGSRKCRFPLARSKSRARLK